MQVVLFFGCEPAMPTREHSGITAQQALKKLKVNFEMYIADRKATTCI